MSDIKGLYKTTFNVWTTYPPVDDIAMLARRATDGDAYSPVSRTVLIPCPEADPDWDGTEFFEFAEKVVVRLLCDRCCEAVTCSLAQCQPGCRHGSLDGDGVCLWPEGPTECQWCGCSDRLTPIPADADGFRNLPTVKKHDEGQWWLSWAEEHQGPYASEAAAWEAWHASEPCCGRAIPTDV